MTENINSSEALNKKYFISMANTRGSVGTLRIHLIALLVLSIIGLIPGTEIHSWYNNLASIIFYGVLKFFVIYAVVLNLYFILMPQKIIYKHQVLTSILLFFTLFMELVILLALSFMIINGKSTGFRSNMADFAGVFFTNFLFILGFLLALLFVAVFPRLLIEVGYLTYLKVVSKDYWEDYKEQQSFGFKGKLKSMFKKKYIYVLMGLVTTIGMEQIDEKYVLSKTVENIFRFTVIIILIGFIIILIQWVAKKIKTKSVGRK
ncbi:hypothetical protein HBP65_14480 [Listeria welshimeri]|nr:hypothetical protein [Listeria welshimeri]